MGLRLRALLAVSAAVALLVGGIAPAHAEPGAITCPPVTVNTIMDTAVSGQVVCTSATGAAITYTVRPFVTDKYGPFSGKLTFDGATGAFTYLPGFYPPDPTRGGVQDVLPEWTGFDNFTVVATAADGATVDTTVTINVDGPATSCDPKFVAKTRTMFNDPSGSQSKQYQMLRHMVKMINCVPARNDDGTPGQIKFSFYSLTYAPIQNALVQAVRRGVQVQALTNSHADKYVAWKALAAALGPDISQPNFATTCWQGCLTPRESAAPGGPTAWYSAEATTITSQTVVFTDRSFPGTPADPAVPANPIVSWQWDFGDGTLVTGPGPHTHDYALPGTYATSLVVTDSAGVTHKTSGLKTLPDNTEPMYPSLHSKIYLFSQVGTGANARYWVSGYSSGNPTYQQARKGFNNLNIAVGDKAIYDIFATYFADMVTASSGRLLTANYFRTFQSPGNAATGARPTTVHLGPQTSGDINREILKSIKCRYKVGKKWKRTQIRVSMFVFTRSAVARDIWRLAFEQGCQVDITYTQMSQRLKDANGNWLTSDDGEPTGYGVADCLATPPTRKVKGRTVINTLGGPTAANPTAEYCTGSTLLGRVPKPKSGVWLNRTSPITGGRLKVHMACPVAPFYDPLKKIWSLPCIRNDIFTHQKVMIVNGFIRGGVQKYVMSGSSNWSSPGLRASDEVITEIQYASKLYDQQLKNMLYLDKVVSRNTSRKALSKRGLPASAHIDVRGIQPSHEQE